MSTTIMDGTGQGNRAGVTSDNHLLVESRTETSYQIAAESGRAFNINDYDKSLSAITGEQAVLYIKNNGDKSLNLINLFGGFWNVSTGTNDTFLIRVYQNPTGGTLISDANELSVANRSAGAVDTFDNDLVVYGASAGGKTFGSVPSTPNAFLIQGSGRLFAGIDLAIPVGQAYGITIETTGGTADYYIGFAGYVEQ
jgi:hypothetical protein